MNKLYIIVGVVLLIVALTLVVLLGGKGASDGGVMVPQPSGDDAALKNLRVN